MKNISQCTGSRCLITAEGNDFCLVTETDVCDCEQLARSRNMAVKKPAVKPMSSLLHARRPNHYATTPRYTVRHTMQIA